MKSLIMQASYLGLTGSKVVMAITFVTALSLLSMTSAFAERNNGHGHGRGNRHNNNQGHREWHGDRDDYWQGHREWRGERDNYWQDNGFRNRRPYYNYSQPVYVPPPVYYGPMQSPGISLFFPLNIHHR